MTNTEGLTLEQTIQQSFDECLQAIHETFAEYGRRLAIDTSKDATSVSTVTASTNKEETYENSPSSDESSIGFGSPLLNFEDETNKETPLLFKPVPAPAPSFSSAMEKVAALPSFPSVVQQAPHSVTTTTTTATTAAYTSSPRDPRLARHIMVEPIVKSVNTPYHRTKSTAVKKPYSRPPARSFSVPKIRFQGTIYNSLNKGIKIDVAEIVTEGLLVDEFLGDFEMAVRQIGLDIEENWYGLIEGAFKEIRERHMELYLWFMKRLFECLPWSGAKTIIQRQIGFHSTEMTNEIKNASYLQHTHETFQSYYVRYNLYAAACKSLNLYRVHDVIHYFLINQSTYMYEYLKQGLKKQYKLKKAANALPFPPSAYVHLTLWHPQEHLLAIALAKVPSSWSEFSQTVISKLPPNLYQPS